MTLAIDATSAPSFSAHSLAAMDDPARAYSLPAWLARGTARVARPEPLEVERPDLRSPGVLRDSALLPLHPPTHRLRPWLASAHSVHSAA
jgi:hypothetical protein